MSKLSGNINNIPSFRHDQISTLSAYLIRSLPWRIKCVQIAISFLTNLHIQLRLDMGDLPISTGTIYQKTVPNLVQRFKAVYVAVRRQRYGIYYCNLSAFRRGSGSKYIVELLIICNSLSDNCVSCTALNNFKSHMRLHWDWKPDSTVRS